MFGIDFSELLIIVIIAVLVLGPDKLPEAMVKIAKFIKSIKRMIGDAQHSLSSELKISELKEETLRYKKELDEATESLKAFKNINPIDDANRAMGEIRATVQSDAKANGGSDEQSVEPIREKVTFKKKTTPIDESDA